MISQSEVQVSDLMGTINYKPTKKNETPFVILVQKIIREFFSDKCYGVRWTMEKHGRLFISRAWSALARLSHDVSDLPYKNRPWRIITKRLLQARCATRPLIFIKNQSVRQDTRATMLVDNELPIVSLISRF